MELKEEPIRKRLREEQLKKYEESRLDIKGDLKEAKEDIKEIYDKVSEKTKKVYVASKSKADKLYGEVKEKATEYIEEVKENKGKPKGDSEDEEDIEDDDGLLKNGKEPLPDYLLYISLVAFGPLGIYLTLSRSKWSVRKKLIACGITALVWTIAIISTK